MEQLYPKKGGLKVLNGLDIFYPKHSLGPESLMGYPLEQMSGYVLN